MSFLSMCRAQMQIIIHNEIMAITVQNTGMLSRNFSAVKTVAKSIVFGGTAKFPPNAVRCVHRHLVFAEVDWSLTWTTEDTDSVGNDGPYTVADPEISVGDAYRTT